MPEWEKAAKKTCQGRRGDDDEQANLWLKWASKLEGAGNQLTKEVKSSSKQITLVLLKLMSHQRSQVSQVMKTTNKTMTRIHRNSVPTQSPGF